MCLDLYQIRRDMPIHPTIGRSGEEGGGGGDEGRYRIPGGQGSHQGEVAVKLVGIPVKCYSIHICAP